MFFKRKEEFKLKTGMNVELHSMEQVYQFTGVIDKIEGGAIFVSNAKSEEVPPIIFNSRVQMKIHSTDDSIHMYFGSICGSSPTFWKINEISEQVISNKRDAYRHPLMIDTRATLLEYDENQEEKYREVESPVRCSILNISAGGLMFSSNTRFSQESYVKIGSFYLNARAEAYNLKCRVLRSTDNDGRFLHGCQFIDMRPNVEEKLIRDIFTLQANELRRRK